jgi:hypothetical protein
MNGIERIQNGPELITHRAASFTTPEGWQTLLSGPDVTNDMPQDSILLGYFAGTVVLDPQT